MTYCAKCGRELYKTRVCVGCTKTSAAPTAAPQGDVAIIDWMDALVEVMREEKSDMERSAREWSRMNIGEGRRNDHGRSESLSMWIKIIERAKERASIDVRSATAGGREASTEEIE